MDSSNTTVAVPRDVLSDIRNIVAECDSMRCTNLNCPRSRYIRAGDPPNRPCVLHAGTKSAVAIMDRLLEKQA